MTAPPDIDQIAELLARQRRDHEQHQRATTEHHANRHTVITEAHRAGWSFTEIAAALGITESAVRAKLRGPKKTGAVDAR